MNLKYYPFTLQLKEAFSIAAGSRTTTELVITELSHGDFKGYGQASLPPYLLETQKSVCDFLSKIDLKKFSDPLQIDFILDEVEKIETGNHSAKAAFDMALFDLVGKILNKPVHELLGIKAGREIKSSFTLGFMSEDEMQKKINEAEGYEIFKIKLGSDHDQEIIESFRKFSAKPFYVDVNQGWKEKVFALEMIQWLKTHGCIFIEQPMPKEMKKEMRWLKQNSPLPLFADESFQTINDLHEVSELFHGINIKLMKCGGLRNAKRIIDEARKLNLAKGIPPGKILLGCMTESSLAVTAAAHLAPLADYCDLDGHLLAKNELFEGIKLIEGKVFLSNTPGIGANRL